MHCELINDKVFATQDIQCGESVCYIARDLITKDEYDTKKFTVSHKKVLHIGSKILVLNMEETTHPKIGQFINDSTQLIFPSDLSNTTDFASLPDNLDALVNYTVKSIAAANVIIDPFNYSIVVAVKNIKKGEEILLSYGFAYWQDPLNTLSVTPLPEIIYRVFYKYTIDSIKPEELKLYRTVIQTDMHSVANAYTHVKNQQLAVCDNIKKYKSHIKLEVRGKICICKIRILCINYKFYA